MFQPGVTVRDRITGFTGVVTGHVRYITGCHQVLVAPPTKDGAFVEPHWFDEQRVMVDESTLPVVLDNGATPGCDVAAPVR